MTSINPTALPLTESVKIVENAYSQWGFLGLFVLTLMLALVFLYKQTIKWEQRYNKVQKYHSLEMIKFKAEHHEDRKVWFENSEKRLDIIVATMKDHAEKFTNLIEGTVRDNNKVLTEVSTVIKQCNTNPN